MVGWLLLGMVVMVVLLGMTVWLHMSSVVVGSTAVVLLLVSVVVVQGGVASIADSCV